MKLVASLIVRNERGRYLEPCITSLLEFCDEIAMVDDASTDGTHGWAYPLDRVKCCATGSSQFFKHEGKARQFLLEWTLAQKPTHVLAIDADEFIADGRALRAAIDHDDLQPVWTLTMQEVWKADDAHLWIRNDGGWRGHDCPILWRVPGGGMKNSKWRIQNKALACGREPQAVRRQFRAAVRSGTEILHFGWTNASERSARHQRYIQHDSGAYHTNAHLKSIMFPDKRVRMSPRDWPTGLAELKEVILARTKIAA